MQAPQSPASQPILVPVRPKLLAQRVGERRERRRCDAWPGSPFSVKETVVPAAGDRGRVLHQAALRRSDRAELGQQVARTSVERRLRGDRPPSRGCRRWAQSGVEMVRQQRGPPQPRAAAQSAPPPAPAGAAATAEHAPTAMRAAAMTPAASVSMTPATMTMEMTRYLRAPSLRKWLRAAAAFGFGTRMAVTISSGRALGVAIAVDEVAASARCGGPAGSPAPRSRRAPAGWARRRRPARPCRCCRRACRGSGSARRRPRAPRASARRTAAAARRG